MEAQEINEKLATEIMGWPIITENTPLRTVTQYGGYILDGRCYQFIIGYCTKEIDFYNDLNHAFMCLHKWLESLSYHLTLVTIFNTKLIKIIRCTLYAGKYYSGDSEENGTESQAICNCLIKAITI